MRLRNTTSQGKLRDIVIGPNFYTVLRILFSFSLPFLFTTHDLKIRVAGFFVFLIAALTDFLDGYLARKMNKITSTGKILDPIADKVLNLTAMFVFAHMGAWPYWVIVIILVRELVVTMVRLRLLAVGEVISAEMAGKVKTTIQSFALGFAYFYLFSRDFSGPAAVTRIFCVLADLFILAALVFTLYSGARFFRERSRIDRIPELIATFFYVGFLPKLPGTFGTAAGIPLALAVSRDPVIYACFTIAVILIGILSSGMYAARAGIKDPGVVVIDEVAGIMVSFVGLPMKAHVIMAGFVLFRVFDILKPTPIRRLENLKEGWGIVLDDVAAGVFTNVCLQVLVYFLP